jgi:hypothetical protein
LQVHFVISDGWQLADFARAAREELNRRDDAAAVRDYGPAWRAAGGDAGGKGGAGGEGGGKGGAGGRGGGKEAGEAERGRGASGEPSLPPKAARFAEELRKQEVRLAPATAGGLRKKFSNPRSCGDKR